jgi:hypothetical protein
MKGVRVDKTYLINDVFIIIQQVKKFLFPKAVRIFTAHVVLLFTHISRRRRLNITMICEINALYAGIKLCQSFYELAEYQDIAIL